MTTTNGPQAANGPLARFRILEIGDGDAISYCGKLFADFGAEVIKCEP